ncbi:hypothetical protein Hanom_Chr02g00133981 [Helianthus anomalus]
MKNVRANTTRGQAQTPDARSLDKSKEIGDIRSVDHDNTPKDQLVKVFDNQPLDVAPLFQKTVAEYEFVIKRDQVVQQLDTRKRLVRPQREVEFPKALRSPYVKRVVDFRTRLDTTEE